MLSLLNFSKIILIYIIIIFNVLFKVLELKIISKKETTLIILEITPGIILIFSVTLKIISLQRIFSTKVKISSI